MESHKFILDRIEKDKKLRILKQEMDPASGISIYIRRGVLSDSSEEERDVPSREWLSFELCENMEEIIDLLLDSNTKSLNRWISSAKQTLKELQLAIQKGDEFVESKKS